MQRRQLLSLVEVACVVGYGADREKVSALKHATGPMSLPIVILNHDEKWDCHQCGFCCRGSLIPLSVEDVERLRRQKWEERSDYRKTRIMVRDRGASGSFRLAHRSDGSCVFLNEDGLCRIHSEFGSEAKPTVCQTFPLQLIPHEKQAVLTIRRACPSAAADLGNATSNHLPFIKELVRDNRLKAESIAPPLLKAGEARDWKTLRIVLESVVESIRGLAILFPVGLWLLRWLSHGREPSVQDMLHIVVALDRSQGFEPLCGPLHRWRLYALGAHQELERLVVWYAR